MAKVAFSKEREAGGSWWVSDGAGCVPRKEEAEMTQRLLDGSGHSQKGAQPALGIVAAPRDLI